MATEPRAVHPATAKGRRAKSILSFADKLQKQLGQGCGPAEEAQALEELKEHIRSLRGRAQSGRHGLHEDADLDQCGTDLWNLCVKLRRGVPAAGGEPAAPGRAELLLHTRVLAFLVLDLAQWSEKSELPLVVHLMRLALKAGRCCVDHADSELAVAVLQRAAVYDERLRDLSQGLEPEEAGECSRLRAEYFVLRTAQSWREDRLDVAEHMFVSAQTSGPVLDVPTAEKLAGILFEIGKGLSTKQDFPMAAKWLQRAHDLIDAQQLHQLSRDGTELRLATSQALVTALLGLKTSEGFEKAQNLVHHLESEIGDKLVVCLLRLEVLNQSPAEVFDCDAYAAVLRRMIRSFGFSEPNFKLLVYHARKLQDRSPGLACCVLDELLLVLSRADVPLRWLEILVITRVLMATSQRDSSGAVEGLHNILDKLDRPLSAEGTVAAQTIIWGNIETNYNQGQFELAEEWTRLGLHAVFQHAGPRNVAKLERKLLLCAMSRNDLGLAQAVFNSAAEATRQEPMTQYLMYKICVRNGDGGLASDCLEAVSRSPNSQSYLYACVIDSQRALDNKIAIEALKKLVETYEFAKPSPVHLPALLRCTIRLLHGLLEGDGRDPDHDAMVDDICNMFEHVVTAVRQDPRDAKGDKLFTLEELEWFCQNAYNLGLKNAGTWHLRHIVRILTSCEALIRAFPPDVASPVAGDLSLKAMFCHFVIASALVSLARGQDSAESRFQDYLDTRKHISAFDTEMQARLESLDEVSRADLLQKLSCLHVFDFEAAACLRKWEELNEIVRRAGACKSVETYEAMADCLLRAEAAVEQTFSTLRVITNEIWSLEGFDMAKLAKYFRWLLHVVLPSRDDLGEILMRELCKTAREAFEASRPFPQEEVIWIASQAYNYGLDCWSRFEVDKCKDWAAMAISLAHYCDDAGQLEGVLHERYAKLQLDN